MTTIFENQDSNTCLNSFYIFLYEKKFKKTQYCDQIMDHTMLEYVISFHIFTKVSLNAIIFRDICLSFLVFPDFSIFRNLSQILRVFSQCCEPCTMKLWSTVPWQLEKSSFKWRVTVSGELFLESYGNCHVTNTVTLLL